MDKGAFLRQLEYSIATNDKRLFAKSIYDLPADVIVGFTREEFSRIIYISHLFGSQEMNELCNLNELFNFLKARGSFSIKNALKGIDELNNYLLSKFYFSVYISLFEREIERVKYLFINYAVACGKLAEMGIDSEENFELTILFFSKARQFFHKGSLSYARASMNEGSIRVILAERDIDSINNLKIAIRLYIDSRYVFSEESEDYAASLMNEGNARQTLAEIGIVVRENLETAINLYSESQKIFFKEKGVPYARALMNEGNARLRLAEIGIDFREIDIDTRGNLETAIDLYSESRKIFIKYSADYASALMNEGTARRTLVEINIKVTENFERSKELYLESILVLEKIGNGWVYSFALLNLNRLLIDYFYKTGERNYLEEWKKNLGDIEEKIKDRDIRHKELLIARIHEIRANLLEFNGKQGISDASFEYYEAYKLSKEPFYKFMKEFCQARSSNTSFCKIVSDWKEDEKTGIFLDYYDYTVFECHLENALKKSIFRKDELELARQKLEGICNRTQIKIIKDRVSAYVLLMNSLDLCFEKGSYEDAAENVRKAYEIFYKFDDKPGCEMCECFHEALLENQTSEYWRSVVQKIFLSGEFSSNFYMLLCNYSDKKRTSTSQDLPLQILKNTNDIKGTLNDLQKMLDQIRLDCISIKDQIGKGFKVTDTELKIINEKIDNIQQDLGNLVWISNDIGGKEGQSIRKFASLMLELMKKGDYEALKRFSEKIVQNSSSIEEMIEAAEIPEKEKAEAKSKLADIKKIPGILKGKAKTFSVGVTENVIANLISGEIVDGEAIKIMSFASGEIIKLLIPVLSTAVFSVPIPSKVVGMLLEAMKGS